MKSVTIHTDGCYLQEAQVGGWAGMICGTNSLGKAIGIELMGSVTNASSSNQMEILAIIKTLSALGEPCMVTLFSDAQGIVGTLKTFREWENTNLAYKPRWYRGMNVELQEKLPFLLRYHIVDFRWVKGHSKNVTNGRVDRLARMSALSLAKRTGCIKPKALRIEEITEKVEVPFIPLGLNVAKSLEIWQL